MPVSTFAAQCATAEPRRSLPAMLCFIFQFDELELAAGGRQWLAGAFDDAGAQAQLFIGHDLWQGAECEGN